MKKFIILCLCSILLIGCGSEEHTKDQTKAYNSIRSSLMDNGGLQSYDIPFDYSIKVEKKKKKYTYKITVNKPQIAMFNIEMMILNPDDYYADYETPSLGIFNESVINMVPNQSNKETGFYNTLSLSGVSETDTFDVYATVAWKDQSQAISYQTYFSFNIVDGIDSKEGLYYEE